MREYFVDTNIFLRFLLEDQPTQSALAKKLLKKAEKGEINLWTTDIVVLEVIWTLKSFYKLEASEIQEKVCCLMALENLKVPNKEIILKALDYFVFQGVSYADAYNFLIAQKEGKGILSFDKDFDKLGKRENLEKLVAE